MQITNLKYIYRLVLKKLSAMHKDGAFKRDPYETSQYTFMIYLNEEYTGGETIFASGEIIRPQVGAALIFHHPLRHEGALLKAGVKYVLRTDIMYRKND